LLTALGHDADDDAGARAHGDALQALTESGISQWALSYIQSLEAPPGQH
jgi:hypothetical protein